ncbi:MAG: DUF4349 domain-containing protein [Clostridiales bacterium]|nr:DUF4349 domain-containing protein [Clostridiales bacterium]
MKNYRKNNRTIAGRMAAVFLVMVLVTALSLGACSPGGGGSSAPAPAPAPAAPMADMAMNEERGYRLEAEAWDVAEDDAGGGFAMTSSGTGNVQSGRKISFRASVSMNTKTFDADYAAINDLVAGAGGYVAHENTSDNSYMQSRNMGRTAWLSALIPAAGYDSFLDDLSEIAEVVNKTKSSDDLTAQYFDTEARIEMLELRKERLMGYLVEAEDAADIVEFERELSNVLYELDNYQGNKRHLDRLVDYATIDINLNELITPETIGKDGEPLGSRASDAFALSTNSVGRFLEGFVVLLAAAVPVIAVIAVIAVIVLVVIKLCRKVRAKIRELRKKD